MYLGPFYFDTKEIFLLLAAIFIGAAVYFNWPLWEFDKPTLLTLTIIMLILKGLLPSLHNEAFFLHAIAAIFLTLFLPLFQVLLFYFITFFLLKAVKVI
ncbi:hypothetical protein A3H80_01465 [Candidatus Roizmanbacteria bacterium RIFCSPLOWO2_02_FULL_37_19]|uniref:Uncharacterized protein n=1 Tax=Candidatus Roizmanbacteria bacterium RIFCSPHIGHO2_02_FULL_37_24 TaxID=1802037 RepID=A0A1F7GW52_9BACT|nr:MAG: hypothetical protein A2862_01485 [Candidatus Roizmanbacteria bacterium RIFCSPHIGHO2_01_FULL_38_41]OGK22994.1 MAG: hypothetical protein A3C24_02540 [Candidatus Roizmanbacteria bacterium RIFCSPHIGHO2_02_FULL_37_24]OGK32225.1 MAG: hypothetical protein A3E10_02185 [Candidatus Roizmanbacteria bacterium RIFCSPHIGHO2_12_FULL_37_23]OGK45653.1 MAG: hypothetical protein A2956_00685 [Candidatus Roizmanbacteria bacterium RIFCSPLOWO2_01_FULL_37_57]OGK53858.1 MAG: hypothetical protein A3H80_01465 [Ca